MMRRTFEQATSALREYNTRTLAMEFEAINKLKQLIDTDDFEMAHVHADKILCDMLYELDFTKVIEQYLKVDRHHT